jgi:outer membrane receptor for ferrienterochelin and colicins
MEEGMVWKAWIAAVGVVAALGGGPVWAAQEEAPQRLDEVVVSATGTAKTILDAPGAVEVITARDIQDLNALTVAEALEAAVGLVVSRESGRVQVPSIRGARSKHTLVLLDGRRLAFGFNDMVDLRQIPTVMVERIEIVRGPASALYGSDSLGGVVNIITKAAPREWTGAVQSQFGVNRDGEAKEYVGSGLVGGPMNRFRFLLSGELRHKDGWDKSGSLPDDGFKEKPGFLAGRFAFDLTDYQTLSAGLEYMDNTYTGDQFYEQQARERKADEERWGYYVQYDAQLRDADQLMLRVNRSEFRNELGFAPFAASGERNTKQFTTQAEARYSALVLSDHLVTVGAEYRRDELDDTQMRLRTDKDVDNVSVLLQDEFHLLDPLYVVLGVRYDHHSAFGDQWSPRGSLVYTLTDGLRLKGSVGQGFRAPSLTELYVTSFRRRGQEVFQANPDLKAEKSTSYELGVEGEHGPFWGGLTGFYTEVDDLIETVFLRTEGAGSDRRSMFEYRNIAEADIKGLEAEAGVRLPLGFSLDGNLTWQDVDNKTGGEDIGGMPKYKGFVKLGYELPEWRLRANLRMSYVGRMTYADGDSYSYPLFGTYLAKGFGENFEIFAGVDNIFDKRIERDDVVQIEPTTFYVGVSAKF